MRHRTRHNRLAVLAVAIIVSMVLGTVAGGVAGGIAGFTLCLQCASLQTQHHRPDRRCSGHRLPQRPR